MSRGRRVLLWLARERPPSASPVLRTLSKTIGALVPVCVLALVVTKQIVTPDVPEEPYKRAYPDLCAEVPAALVAEGVRSVRILDRDSSECAWTSPPEDGGTTVTVSAARPDVVYSTDSPVDDAMELYVEESASAETDTADNAPDPAPGFGDEAAWYSAESADRTVGVLVVRWGVRVLSVTVSTADGPLETVRSRVEAIAAAVLPLLPPD